MHFLCVFLVSAYSAPGTLVGSGERAVNKMRQETPCRAYDLREESGWKETQ